MTGADITAPVRLCIFNRSYWPDTGATGQLLTELAEDLVADHGFQVTIITGYPTHSGGGLLPHRETRNGVAIVRVARTTFHPRRFAARAFNYVSYLASAFVTGVRLPRQDVLVAMTDPPIIGLVALLLRRRAKVVFVCQDLFPEVAQLLEDFRSTTVDRILEGLTRTIVRHADRTIALGETMAARLVASKRADPSRLTIIHNWADTDAIAPGPRDNAFSRHYDLNGQFVVLHAGNIGFGQDLDTVMKAAQRLRARDDIAFLFVGDGNRRAELEAHVHAQGLNNVRFVPYQPRDRVPAVYASADTALVLLKQGLAGCIVPSKLYTILAAGRSVVAAVEESSETAAIVREHACGCVVPPGDDQALARAIVELAADREACARLGTRAREASANFSRRRQVARYAATLRDVLGARC